LHVGCRPGQDPTASRGAEAAGGQVARGGEDGMNLNQAESMRRAHRRENVPLYWGCAGRAARAAGVLRAEILTPDLKLLLAQTALCWPRGNVGYKRSPHQSTTPRRETA